MRSYAFIRDGAVWEIIAPQVDAEGHEIPVEHRYTPEFCASLVDITDAAPQPEQDWFYAGGAFSEPPKPLPPAE